MSIDKNHPEYLNLRFRLRENPKEFVAVVGAGLSRPAGLPSWVELRDDLIENARARASEISDEERDGYLARISCIRNYPDLWDAFTELSKILPQSAYDQVIRDRLTLKQKDKVPLAYDLLWQLGIKGIITFNADTCAIDSFARVNKCSVDASTAKETARFPHYLVDSQQFVFQPHGIVQDRSSWVFTRTERSTLLGTQAYLDFMKVLCQSKHLVIIGFDTSDFSFEYLVQQAMKGRSFMGSNHFLFLPNVDRGIIDKWSEEGFSVIPYSPGDTTHPEILECLKDYLEFLPQDDIPTSIYTGTPKDPSSLPSDEELSRMPIQDLREILNGAVAAIIPPGLAPSEEDVDRLEEFYSKHLRSIHMAWLIQPKSECEMVHGYRVIEPKGRGAFGQVYVAEHAQTGKRLAIKVLLPEVRYQREYLNSFRRGVHSMRILTERKIDRMVPLINAFEVPACILMEYVDGPTLTQASEWGLLTDLVQCLDILVQIGEVVHQAHNLEERVLHRDLKPDNVILRNTYNFGDTADVVVVDFDLSWHKGASELSVVHGARAQGYAAPEQTATGHLKGVSTRHTAVDAFGYGMLGFFLFTGSDPRPNEQKFEGFEENLRDEIRKRFVCRWNSLPAYLARIVCESTRDRQQERIPFIDALEAFRKGRRIASTDETSSTDPIILEELCAILDPDAVPVRRDFGRQLTSSGADPSKKTMVRLVGEGDQVYIEIELEKNRSVGDQRNVAKYLEKAKDKAVSKLKKHPFEQARGHIGQSVLIIRARWPLNQTVSHSEVQQAVESIREARSEMELQ